MQPRKMPNEVGFWYVRCKFPKETMQMQMQSDILEVCKMRVMVYKMKVRACKMKVRVGPWTW